MTLSPSLARLEAAGREGGKEKRRREEEEGRREEQVPPSGCSAPGRRMEQVPRLRAEQAVRSCLGLAAEDGDVKLQNREGGAARGGGGQGGP